jgi:hypothetical protein
MVLKAFQEAMEKAMGIATHKGLVEAQVMSQGPNSLGALAREDHPYAKRHGFPLRDPAIINEQTGAFLRDWKEDPVAVIGDTVQGAILNFNPVADYLKNGTKFMFQRPIDEEIEAKTATFLEDEIRKQLRIFETTDFYL